MTHETLICNVCDKPGTFDNSADVGVIKCNVRRFADQLFTIWRCSNCLSLHCKETVNLDTFYADYPVQRQTIDFAADRAFHNRLRVLKKHGLTAQHAILDFGSGTSLFVDFLKQRGFAAVGYDPYVPAVSDRQVLNKTYDFITTQDVIEHVDSPFELLKECVQRLNPNGILAVGTPNAEEIDLSEKFSMELHPPYHRHILSEDALLNLCGRAGLSLRAMYPRFYYDTLFPMVNTQFIRRYVRKSGGLIDVAFGAHQVGLVMTSAELLFFGFFGYFFRARGHLLGIFQR